MFLYATAGTLGFRNEWAWWPSLQGHLKQGPGHFLPLLVDGNLDHVGQWLKGGIWPNLIRPSLALPVLPNY